MSASEADSLEADNNPPTDAPPVSVMVQGAGDSQEGRNLAQVSPQF